MTQVKAADRWWSCREPDSGQGLQYALGPLSLGVFREADAWHLWFSRGEWDESAPYEARIEVVEGVPEDITTERFVFGSSPSRICLRPMLADRPVVVRARQAVFIPPGEEALLYLSTPVWLAVDLGDPAQTLKEVPVQRLSDTWFGPSTREGELCYAARTHARNHLEEVPRRAHRAVTPVTIRNEARSLLPIEKLSLPVPMLSVFGDSRGGLWTEEIRLIRAADSDLAALRVMPGSPGFVGGATRLSEPRTEPARGGLVRAFTDLFG